LQTCKRNQIKVNAILFGQLAINFNDSLMS